MPSGSLLPVLLQTNVTYHTKDSLNFIETQPNIQMPENFKFQFIALFDIGNGRPVGATASYGCGERIATPVCALRLAKSRLRRLLACTPPAGGVVRKDTFVSWYAYCNAAISPVVSLRGAEGDVAIRSSSMRSIVSAHGADHFKQNDKHQFTIFDIAMPGHVPQFPHKP